MSRVEQRSSNGPGEVAMPLHAYRHARLVVQNARTTVFEAARAMSTNEIGCVVVCEGYAIVGIVTDRDIALRVVGGALDPRQTTLGEVMSRGVVTLPPDAVVADALGVMRDRRVRRVPLVEDGRVVGMVTLDDLLFESAAPLPEIAAVVKAQIIETGPARTRRFDEWDASERRYARAWASRTKMVAEVQTAAGLDTRAQAEAVLYGVLATFVRRLGAAGAATLVAQLPALIRSRLSELPPGPDASVTRAAVDAAVARELGVSSARAAAIVNGVGRVLATRVPAVEAIARRLPPDLRSILRPPESARVASRRPRTAPTGRRPGRPPAARLRSAT